MIPVEARPGEFLVDLDAGWSSLVGVHGGYMCTLAVRGAESMASGRVVRTMSTSFLRSGHVGPAELSVREVRRGRSITTMVAELAQDQQVLSVSRLTLMTERSGLEWSEPRPVDLPPPAYSCAVLAAGSCGESRCVAGRHIDSDVAANAKEIPAVSARTDHAAAPDGSSCGSILSGCRSPATAPTWPGTCARSRHARSTRRGW